MDFRGKREEPDTDPWQQRHLQMHSDYFRGTHLFKEATFRELEVRRKCLWWGGQAERRGCLAPGPVLGDGGHGVWPLPSLSKEVVQSEAVRISQSPGRIPDLPWATPPVHMQRPLYSRHSLIKLPHDGSQEPCSSHDLITLGCPK